MKTLYLPLFFKMKSWIVCILFISFSPILMSQVYEIGFSVGGTNYVGDIGSTRYIQPNQLAGNVFFKYNYNPRIAFKGTYSYLPIKGDDATADTPFRINRNTPAISFSNTIHELALGMEFNFYEYNSSSSTKNWTPYLLIELAAFNYDAIEKEEDLNENGQIDANEYQYDRKTRIAIPIGVGFKSILSGPIAFALETKIRYTFEDDLDKVAGNNRDLKIEGNSNDWYVFTGVSLIYTFGRPSCYARRN